MAMVKAQSLLYAVYICLIVSILCCALLYFSSLFNQLNLFYNTREDLYIQNQSAVNYALGSGLSEDSVEESGIFSSFEIRPHGLADLLIVRSSIKTDTVASAHFIGHYANSKECMYLANFSKGLTFGGIVKLIGDKKLPIERIREEYLNNVAGKLTTVGAVGVSDVIMPKINSRFEGMFTGIESNAIDLKEVIRTNDSVYYNSFLKQTITIDVTGVALGDIVIKGNFILKSRDSIVIRRKAVLEDVILKAPRINFSEGFKGTVQAFCSEMINVGEKVELMYPSVLCLYNNSIEKSKIAIGKGCRIYGAVVLFGNEVKKMEDNEVLFKEESLLVGDIYCSGKLMIGGKVYGSVYTNRFFHRNDFGEYDNCIINAEIDITKRPAYFVSISLFENDKKSYGLQKKVL